MPTKKCNIAQPQYNAIQPQYVFNLHQSIKSSKENALIRNSYVDIIDDPKHSGTTISQIPQKKMP